MNAEELQVPPQAQLGVYQQTVDIALIVVKDAVWLTMRMPKLTTARKATPRAMSALLPTGCDQGQLDAAVQELAGKIGPLLDQDAEFELQRRGYRNATIYTVSGAHPIPEDISCAHVDTHLTIN